MFEDIDTISLHKIGRKRISDFVVAEERKIPISIDAREEKAVVDLKTSEKHPASLFVRKLTEAPFVQGLSANEISSSLADKYIRAWRLSRDRGMNVVDTVRKIDDCTVAVTNLETKGTVYDAKIDSRPSRKQKSADDNFLLVSMKSIEEETMNQVKIANENGIFLPFDGVFHLFIGDEDSNENFTWKVMLLDMTNMEIFFDPSEMSDKDKERNVQMARNWLERIRDVHDIIWRNQQEPYDY